MYLLSDLVAFYHQTVPIREMYNILLKSLLLPSKSSDHKNYSFNSQKTSEEFQTLEWQMMSRGDDAPTRLRTYHALRAQKNEEPHAPKIKSTSLRAQNI